MTVIYQNELNTPGVLRSFFFQDGTAVDPFLVQYTIIGPDHLPIVGQLDKLALRNNVGEYYVDWQLSQSQPLGIHRITWDFMKDSSSQFQSASDEFNVIRDLSEKCEAIHIPSGSGMGTSPGGNGAGNADDSAAGFVIRDFWGRVRVFNL